MENGDIQKIPSDKTPDVIELDAVEINTPHRTENDLFENSEKDTANNTNRRTPPFVFTYSQNGCNSCCLGTLILFILFVLAIF